MLYGGIYLDFMYALIAFLFLINFITILALVRKRFVQPQSTFAANSKKLELRLFIISIIQFVIMIAYLASILVGNYDIGLSFILADIYNLYSPYLILFITKDIRIRLKQYFYRFFCQNKVMPIQ